MKKTLAAVGASILGLAGALGGSAAPAGAAPLPCTNALNDHVVNPDVTPATDGWYMTCTPQYGMGKAEFSITAPAGGFPAGYSLDDGHQTVVSSTPTAAQVQSYFGDFYADDHGGTPVYTGAFINLTEDTADSTATTQVYQNSGSAPMTAAYPITSVGKLTTGLPAACSPNGETYEGEYVVNYAPVTTTFSELVGSKVYKTTVTLTAPTLYLGLNFNSSGTLGFDDSKALCATSSAGTLFGPASQLGPISAPARTSSSNTSIHTADLPTGTDAWYTIANDAATNDSQNLTTLVPTTSSDLDSDPAPIVSGGPFVVTATPTLAETGVDATPAGIIGGSLLIVGVGAFLFGRRRRRSATHRD